MKNKKMASLRSKVHDLINNDRVNAVMRYSLAVAKDAEPFLNNPSFWHGLRLAFSAAKNLDEFQVWSDNYFESRPEWHKLFDDDITNIIAEVLADSHPQVLKTGETGMIMKVHHLDDVTALGYCYYTKTKMCASSIYVKGEVDRVYELLAKIIWEKFGSDFLVLAGKRGLDQRSRSGFGPDVGVEPLSSPRAEALANYFKRALSVGVKRSAMLYGPPGTGKSTMAREVVRRLGLRSLRIRVEDVGTLDNNSILQALLILKPDVVILDDFDRNSSQSHLFEALENLQKNVKIVLATVNERNRLDEALLRPGRFDEMICVDRLDEEVVRLVLGPDCQDSFEQVKDWPIAFINEFAKRRLFLSPAEAKSSMDELIKRVARVRAKHTTDDLEERFLDAAAGNLDDSPKEE